LARSAKEVPTVCLFGALDTKGEEYGYVQRRLQEAGCRVIMVDTGVLGGPRLPSDVTRAEVALAGGAALSELQAKGDRGAAMQTMAAGAAAAADRLYREGKLNAAMGLGGSNAAFVMSAVAAVLPVGVPKVLVSTIVSGDTRAYVGATDMTMLYPVVDISGLNSISRKVLANAAAACAGMAWAPEVERATDKPVVGISMFGVTTQCCAAIRDRLGLQDIEPLTFHATGVGGRSMEALIRSGHIQAVADITTTELADDLVGGVCSAGPERLTAAASAGVPQVVSLGALDMVNFGPPQTVPQRFAHRLFHQHNPNVTLMRTSVEECAELGRRISRKLNTSRAAVAVLVPRRGLSQISVAGQPFYDPAADGALITSLLSNLSGSIDVREFDTDINDPLVSAAASELVAGWLGQERR